VEFHEQVPALVDRVNRALFVDLGYPFFLGMVFLSVLFSLDVITTSIILKLGGVELNGVMAPVVTSMPLHALLKWAVIVFIIAIARWCDDKVRNAGLLMVAIVIVWYGIVIMNNTAVMMDLVALRFG
jgi:hypothetical protein